MAAAAHGFKDQLWETLREIKRDTGKDPLAPAAGSERFQAVLYMADVMYTAISIVVVKAREAMKWLQELAALVAEEGLPMRWTAPSGLSVIQRYMEPVRKELDFRIAGRDYRLTLMSDGSKLDKRRQRSGIAANYSHSLDAAHLVRSVNYAADAGIAAFAMVHDSYGTHAGNTGELAKQLRRAPRLDRYGLACDTS